ncbi:MAG: hypothetical protein AB7L41_06025 [Flavobacteriaceae bacterium]
MKRFLIALPLIALPLAACNNTTTGAAIGGVTGAAIGAAASGGNTGATVAGGVVGAVAGAVIGRATEPGYCRYRDRYGREYVARCPANY